MTSLRFFVDHCISNAIMDALRATGTEVLRLREHLPTDAPDMEEYKGKLFIIEVHRIRIRE